MLTSIRLKDFKSVAEGTLPLTRLTLLIGANGSGKSNVLEAIRLLTLIAKGARLDDIASGMRAGDCAIRGRRSDLFRHGSTRFILGCRFDDAGLNGWRDFEIAVNLSDDQLIIASEQITSQNPGVTNAILRSLSNILFLTPHPAVMRGHAHKEDGERMREDGQNLSAILYRIAQEPERKSRLLEVLRSLHDHEVTDIQFLSNERNEVMVRLVEAFGHNSSNADARMLSDGTLRVLAVVATLLTAPAGALVILKDIDYNIYPGRTKSLLHQVQALAAERELHVLLAAQSPALLDAVSEHLVRDVVVCFRDPQDGASHLLRLGDMDNYAELVAQGPLGYLATHRILDRFVKDRRSPDQRQQEALDWLRRHADGSAEETS